MNLIANALVGKTIVITQLKTKPKHAKTHYTNFPTKLTKDDLIEYCTKAHEDYISHKEINTVILSVKCPYDEDEYNWMGVHLTIDTHLNSGYDNKTNCIVINFDELVELK